ncbi:MAG: nucleotidyltransferase [Bacteroidetes bacterium GWF2_49_14]|nr:MAG: nucleotidyltransferase [Bacteroidetes bacterium GWF2_49_14]HBB91783.1 nucleotidyl transferase AbiEii/AbiGii toxin family protein [Bacteroidales bacterium]
MIPQSYITEWSRQVPWRTNEQVEQDLVICRALVEIFSDNWLADSLAFRGGTALHKLYLNPQPRYSEDIDLVQVRAEPIKETVRKLQECLSFLGNASVIPRKDGIRLKFGFDSEFAPVQKLRLKVETNTREHFTALGYDRLPFEVQSAWFKGHCDLTTYRLEELLGTKLRALYQRRKGRDLYDLFIALSQSRDLDLNALLHCYHTYMAFSVEHPPNQREYILNMELKMKDPDFLGDTMALLRPEMPYDPNAAYDLVRKQLIARI